jgi:hypothetical protein
MKKLLSYLPPFLLAIGAIVRIAGTGASAIWFDEAVSLQRTSIPFMTLYSDGSEYSGCLLLDLLLRPLAAIGHSLWLLRLPSLLAGLGCLWMVWKLMQSFKLTIVQQIAVSALVAFLPGPIWMSQDARIYSILSLLFLGAIWCAMEGKHLGLVALCGLLPYAHNIGPVYAATVFVIALAIYPWKIRTLLRLAAWTSVAWIPALAHLLQVAQTPFWTGPLTLGSGLWSWLTALWAGTLGNGLGLILALALLAVTIPLGFPKIKSPFRKISGIAWTLPIAALLLASVVWQNIFTYRVLMPLAYPFALWLGWELGLSVPTERFRRPALAAFWGLMLVVGLVGWHPSARGADLDRSAAAIRSAWRSGDVLYYATDTVRLPFEYYIGDLDGYLGDIVTDPFLVLPGSEHTAAPFSTLIGPIGYQRVWLVIPDEPLFNPTARVQLNLLIGDRQPVLHLHYLQAAPINVYLIGE